jgi:hypothetical protein
MTLPKMSRTATVVSDTPSNQNKMAHLMTLPKMPSTATVVSATPSNQNKMAASVERGPTIRNQI